MRSRNSIDVGTARPLNTLGPPRTSTTYSLAVMFGLSAKRHYSMMPHGRRTAEFTSPGHATGTPDVRQLPLEQPRRISGAGAIGGDTRLIALYDHSGDLRGVWWRYISALEDVRGCLYIFFEV